MRRALGLLLASALWGCGAPPASAPTSPATPAVAPPANDAGAAAATADPSADSPPLASPEPALSEPVAASAPATAKPEETATPAVFGRPLEPGLYVFPDGLRLRVQQIAGCDFDTSVPCFAGTIRAHATLGKKEATVEWSTRSAVVLGHRIELVAQVRFIVRK